MIREKLKLNSDVFKNLPNNDVSPLKYALILNKKDIADYLVGNDIQKFEFRPEEIISKNLVELMQESTLNMETLRIKAFQESAGSS